MADLDFLSPIIIKAQVEIATGFNDPEGACETFWHWSVEPEDADYIFEGLIDEDGNFDLSQYDEELERVHSKDTVPN